jgi:hypothetical protein
VKSECFFGKAKANLFKLSLSKLSLSNPSFFQLVILDYYCANQKSSSIEANTYKKRSDVRVFSLRMSQLVRGKLENAASSAASQIPCCDGGCWDGVAITVTLVPSKIRAGM